MNYHYQKVLDLQKKFSIKNDTEFCKVAKISRSTISELKANRTEKLGTDTLAKICNAFSVPLDFFVKDLEQKETPVPKDERTEEYSMLFNQLADKDKETILNNIKFLLSQRE